MNVFGISEKNFDELIHLLAQSENIEKAVLFGSRAMGTYSEGSDIDIALCGTNLKLKDQLDISNKLEKLDYPYSYDFQIYKNINDPDVLDHINRVGIVIYKKSKSEMIE